MQYMNMLQTVIGDVHNTYQLPRADGGHLNDIIFGK
jgi:hypothetical protein